MEVEDGLTGVGTGVRQNPVAAFVESGLMGDLTGHPEQFAEQCLASGRRRQVGDMAPRNDEDVGRSLWGEVGERHGVRRLRHEGRAEVTPDDSAEDAIRVERQFRSRVVIACRRIHS